MTKYGSAKTIKELILLLTKVQAEFGPNVHWYGWDDESLILYRIVEGVRDEFAYIENTHFNF